jgi:dihydroorotate dehydrogenase (fumarate)
VLFNRLIQPDIDLEHMEAATKIHFSTSDELALSLRWVALLYGRIDASLAATGGIHDATDLIKVLLAGANVGLVASVLYQRGVDQIGAILSGVESWMTANDYSSVKQLLGSMSRERCPNATVFQSGNYMKTLTSFVGKAI